MGFFRRRRSPDQLEGAGFAATTEASPATAEPKADESFAWDLAGVSLHCKTWGSPSAERAALLVHGLTASHKEWDLLGPALAEAGHFVVAPDLRGRGLSSKPAHGYSIAIHAADLAALCDAFGRATVDVVGHSLGAVIGMYMAALYPARVRRLVMVDAGGKIPEDTAQAIGASVSRLGLVYPSLDAYLGLMRQLPMLQWNDAWEEYFRYDADVRQDGTVVSRVSKAAIEEESLALALTRSEALPDLVRASTLLVRATVGLLGPDRGLILPRDEAERLQGIIPDCRLIEIEGANHYTVVHASQFMRETTSFLSA